MGSVTATLHSIRRHVPKTDLGGIVVDAESGEIIDTTAAKPPLSYAFSKFIRSGKLWCCVAVHSCTFFCVEVQSLLNLYLGEAFNAAPEVAALVASAYNIGSTIAVFTAGLATDKLSSKQLMGFWAALFGVSGASFMALINGPRLGLRTTAGLLLGCGCVVPSIYIPAQACVMRLGGAYSSTLSSIVDAPSQVVSVVLLSFVYPRLMALCGWPLVWKGLTGLFSVGGLFCVFLQYLEHRNPDTGGSLIDDWKPVKRKKSDARLDG
eukprot:SAG31_NODE_6252_length_2102_cov_1.295057_1_plen_265_part_00